MTIDDYVTFKMYAGIFLIALLVVGIAGATIYDRIIEPIIKKRKK